MSKRILLAIGCDKYQHLDELSGAEIDSKNIFSALAEPPFGSYDTTRSRILLSPTLSEIKESLIKILFDEGPIDTLTIFFAGHGGVKSGSYYLCPIDAKYDRLSATALSMSAIFSQINEAPPNHTNIIIDACQAGGLVTDLGALLKPELIGSADTAGITIFASTSANEDAADTDYGGPGTQTLLHYIFGRKIVKIATEYLDLITIGQLASDEVRAIGAQSPVVWGLNLHGEAKFCRNPHFDRPITNHTSFPRMKDSEIPLLSAPKAHAEAIWEEFITAGRFFSPPRFRDALSPAVETMKMRPDELSDFILGIASTFGQRVESTGDSFAKPQVYATCLGILQPNLIASSDTDKAAKDLLDRLALEIENSMDHLSRELKRNKYHLLDRPGGFADFYYLPLRISQILGWCSTRYFLCKLDGTETLRVSTQTKILLNDLLHHYEGSIRAITDKQTPYIVALLSMCTDLGWKDEAERILGLLYSDLVYARGRIANANIPPHQIIPFLFDRAKKSAENSAEFIAAPQELLAMLLLFSTRLHLQEIIDPYLMQLDHTSLNVFIPNNLLDFADEIILNGINHSFRIGHGIWTADEFEKEFVRSCKPHILKDSNIANQTVRAGALVSAMIFPNRSPWFLCV